LRDATTRRTARVFVGRRTAGKLVAASQERDRAIDATLLAASWRVGTLDEADGKHGLHAAFDLA
jgi:hypothetical protein